MGPLEKKPQGCSHADAVDWFRLCGGRNVPARGVPGLLGVSGIGTKGFRTQGLGIWGLGFDNGSVSPCFFRKLD